MRINWKRAWPLIATVVGLALIIVGVAAISKPKAPSGEPSRTDSTLTDQQTYDQAQQLLGSGETTKAVVLLKKAAASDANGKSAVLLTKVEQEKSTSSSTLSDTSSDTDTTTATPATEPSSTEAALPAYVSGWALAAPEVDVLASSVGLDPLDPALPASHAIMTVFKRDSATAAKAYIVDVSKSVYTQNAATVSVAGVKGYFGTNGNNLATLSFAKGRYVYEVIVSSISGTPTKLKPLAKTLAAKFTTS